MSLRVLNVPNLQAIKDKRQMHRADVAIVAGRIVKNRHGAPGKHVGGVFVVYDEERLGESQLDESGLVKGS